MEAVFKKNGFYNVSWRPFLKTIVFVLFCGGFVENHWFYKVLASRPWGPKMNFRQTNEILICKTNSFFFYLTRRKKKGICIAGKIHSLFLFDQQQKKYLFMQYKFIFFIWPAAKKKKNIV